MDDMDIVLQKEPENRLALVYRAVACNRGALGLSGARKTPVERYVKVRSETRQHLLAPPDDYYARIVCLSLLHEISGRKQIQSELQRIVQEAPENQLAWSALAGHCFSLVRFDSSKNWLVAAQKSACEALRLCWDDKLAFSVLWWSTEGSGAQEFSGKLSSAQTTDGQQRFIYRRLDSEFDSIFDGKILLLTKL